MCPSVFPAKILAQFGVIQLSLAAVPPSGGYLSIIKILGMLVLLVPWLMIAPWVQRDSKRVLAPKGLWAAIVLAIGTGAFLVWLVLPIYFVGLILYTVAVALVLISYLSYRNNRVEDDQKISLRSLLFGKTKAQKEKIVTRLILYDSNSKAAVAPSEDSEEPDAVRAYNLTQELMYDMVWRRASEADLAPKGQKARLRFVVDGAPVERPRLSLSDSETIIQYLKPLAGMSAEEHRRPQKGHISVDLAGSPIDVLLTVAGTTSGQRMRCRIVQESVRTKLDDLGISSDMVARIREINQSKHGLFIISGPPGSGVTSTLYSLLCEQDAFTKQLVTLEAKVDVDLENVTQHEYGDASNLSKALAQALRRDPDVVMIDACSETNTAQLICQSAAEKFVLLGIQAPNSFNALAKWINLCGNSSGPVEHLQGVLSQMQLRLLCQKCREPYKPNPQMLAKANIPANKVDVFFRPSGQLTESGAPRTCPACQGSGYFERTAAFELLEITDELRQQVISGASLSQIKAVARKNKMLYLQEQALQKVIAGETSVQEVIRVSQQKK
jgi:type II secretory ATPase GspE/PulE/Tfp pilus assembly ATPase PilB-like protein